jgi:hypothetical protein
MNLALHDLHTFQTLRREGQTGDWAERGIVAWAPHGMVCENACLREYVGEGAVTVHSASIPESETGVYETFREGFSKSLVETEVRLLFLAKRNESVVFTSDGLVRGCAERLGLCCWSGDTEDLNALFPIPRQQPLGAMVAPNTRETTQHFPTRRQVPGRDESMGTEGRRARGLNAPPPLSATMQ